MSHHDKDCTFILILGYNGFFQLYIAIKVKIYCEKYIFSQKDQ